MQHFAKVFVWVEAARCANTAAELGIIWNEAFQPLRSTSPNKDKVMTNKEEKRRQEAGSKEKENTDTKNENKRPQMTVIMTKRGG